jgi:hypothetical protein
VRTGETEHPEHIADGLRMGIACLRHCMAPGLADAGWTSAFSLRDIAG